MSAHPVANHLKGGSTSQMLPTSMVPVVLAGSAPVPSCVGVERSDSSTGRTAPDFQASTAFPGHQIPCTAADRTSGRGTGLAEDCNRQGGPLTRITWSLFQGLSTALRRAGLLVLVPLLLAAAGGARADAIVQEFYVPMPEAQLRQGFLKLAPAAGATLDSVISIAVPNAGVRIVYDHWEDGYEVDIHSPTQSTTVLWGDGNGANGKPPGFATDPLGLPAGSVIALRNLVPLPRTGAILYDGRDRVASTQPIVMSRSAWATSPGPLLADATEVPSIIDYGTSFTMPVGQDIVFPTPATASMFEYVAAFIMASENGTAVAIDRNGDGTVETTLTLNQGESYLVDGGVLKGAKITSTKGIQVQLFTGDIGANYENRWFSIPPDEVWSSEYYSPVGTAADGDDAYIFLHNPNGSAIDVNYATRSGSGSFSIPATDTYRFLMPQNSGARFTAADSSQRFYGVGTVGAEPTANNVHDWGFDLVPSANLTTQLVVGWGPGSSDGTQNGSPAWVTSLGPTTIYVDYNGDRLGPLTDPKGNKYDLALNVGTFDVSRIYEPDKDQTGLRMYTLDGTLITGAWGQDPAVAGPAMPYLDVGTTIPNLPIPVLSKTAKVVTDSDPEGPSIGDVVEYTLTLENKGLVALSAIPIIDTPPTTGLTYVATSTTRDNVAVPDDSTPGTPFPLDGDGLIVPIIPRGANTVIKYRYTINATGSFKNVASTSLPDVATEYTLVVPAGTTAQCSIDYSNGAGAAIDFLPDQGLYVTLTDADANTSVSSAQTVTVFIKNTTNGDVEQITLTETGNNTGVFRNVSAFPSSTTAGGLIGDDTLNAVLGDSLDVTYTDPVYGDTCSGTATIVAASQAKQLYLNADGSDDDTTGGLDRVDPANVSPQDTTTSSTATLGSASGTITAGTTTSQQGSGTSLSFTHATNTGSNRLLVVTIGVGINTNPGTAGTVSGVTFAGTLMTQVGTAFSGDGARVYIYTLKDNPPSYTMPTSGTVAITASTGSVTEAGATTFSGVDQTTPYGSPATNSNSTGTSLTVGVASAVGDVVVAVAATDEGGSDQTITTSTTGSQTQLWNFSGINYVSSAASTKPGAAGTVTSTFTGLSSDWAAAAVSLKPAAAVGSTTATFTQTPSFASAFDIPANQTLTIKSYYSLVSGSIGTAITASLKVGGTAFLTDSTATATSDANGTYLEWSGTLGSAETIASGEAITLEITSALASGNSFKLDYDSASKPSKITLPTTTVIKVDSVGVYDAPYPGGSLVTTPANGQILYIRATVSDPFGAADITSVPLAIDGPGTADDISTTLTNVVASTAASKTFEYVWVTGATAGSYSVAVTGKEGYENAVTDQKSTTVTLSALDLGTPSTTEFTTGLNGPGTETYAGGELVCVRITDLDQNTNAALVETVQATITSSSGDSELVTLTETGVNTGVFTTCINASPSGGTGNNNSTLNAPLGAALTVVYTDPTDPSDTSSDTARVPSGSPTSVVVTKTLVAPADGKAIVGEAIQFRIRVVNTGTAALDTVALDDTYEFGSLDYVSATPTPSVVTEASGTLAWSDLTGAGSLAAGATIDVDVSFLALAPDATATNSAVVSGSADAGPAAASVEVTNPKLTVTKTRLTPASGSVNKGENQVYSIVVNNTGSTAIATLPLQDTYSGACFSFVSATVTPDSSAAGSLLWNDITGPGSLAASASQTIDVTLQAKGSCDPGNNLAAVDYAVDDNGDPVPPASGNAGVTTVAATVSGIVYEDQGTAGFGGDTPLAGVTVTLYTDPNGDGNPADGVVAGTTTTDAAGYYEFPNLGTGHYVVVEYDPFGYISIDDTGSDDPSPGAAGDPQDIDNRIPVNVTTLTAYLGNNFLDDRGAFGTISGQVRNDADGDGNLADSESGIDGVTITLYTDPNGDGNPADGVVVRTATTAGGGNYSFDYVPPGNYVVVESDPAGFTSTNDTVGPNDNRIPVVRTGTTPVTEADFLDSQTPNLATLGDRVWLDENSDGVQDAGEDGLANVTVELRNASAALIATTVTDADGGYRFTGVPAGSYTVELVTASLATGLLPIADEDDPASGGGAATPHASAVTVVGGAEHLSADFGYNWVSYADTTDPNLGATGAIGDRVWNDANGNGAQDPGEAGIGGVTVGLFSDPDGNGVYDTPYAAQPTATTDAAGNYVFDGLPAGAYVVAVTPPSGGWIATGDPDTTLDGRTTTPVILAPGDAYLNADFGYQLQASGTPSGSTIGDRVYLDLDGDGTDNSGTDPGLAGVSVSLLDSTGTVIATDLTDATGGYRFPGLPAGDYTVVVTDTGNVLAYYEQTGDPSLPTPSFDGRSTVTVDGITDNLLQDFGYRAPSQNAGNTLGVIGDTVYLDSNGDNAFDAGEGLAGVTVELFAADGTTLIATTVTDTNGGYLFAGLDSGATYVVKVDGATLPAGLTNTVDPDLTPGVAGNGESSRNLSTLGATDLAADFGYRDTSDPNSVSGLVWLDPNADGTRSAPEGVRFDGVTVELRDAAGFLIGTAITDGTGAYGFANLPDGQYTVHVTDTAGVLTGTWHSLGTDSATDPITVTLTSGTNATADFGYYRDGAALGNRAWVDADNDGLQDAGETTGAADVAISLLITYPNGATSTVVTRTGADGSYRFGDLLLDESFASSTAGTPTTGTGPRYRISAAVAPTGYVAGSKLDVGTDDKRDSDAHSGVTAAALARGDTDVTVNAADPSAETGQGSYDFSYLASGSLFSLSGTVYHDADGNGNLTERSSAGGSETALSGVSITVTLYTDPNGDGDPADGAPEGSPVVTTDGTYSFANLTAGNYVVVETNPAGYVSTNDVDAPNNDRIGVTLSANLVAQDFLDTLTANSNLGSIAGSVLTDTVGGGSFGDAGAGIPNVVVELWLDTDADGVPDTLYDTTTTDGSGNYSFTAVPPGTYVIVETNPSGYASTNDVAGANDDRIPVALDPKAALTNQNFLDYQGTPTLASLSGQVRDDADGNGNLADADSGIDGVTVTLWRDTDGNGTPDSVYGSATTGGGGLYSFTGLPVGAYVVVETDPSGYTSTADVVNPNDNRIPETLTASEEVTGRDFLDALSGVAQVAPISGRVIDDPDGDGDLPERTGEPGITGATVQLFTDPNGDGDPTDGVLYDTTVTGSNGAYSFPNVPPGNYVVVESDPSGYASTNDTVGPNDNRIPVVRTGTDPVANADFLDSQTPNLATLGDRVWLDENSDGVQDAGEDGLGNVTLVLKDQGGATIATTLSDADGGYRFTGVPAGSYTVEVVTASLATGLLPIADEDDPLTGGLPPTTPHVSAVTVVGGEAHDSADFGYNWISHDDVTDPNLGATGAIGDRVWNDANGNGAQDPGEAGIGGVTVGLFSDPDGNGVYDTPYAAQPTATTDAAGNYVFDGLPAGAYVVAVTPPSGGWIATGDPDTTLDGRTTTPVILAPGDAYLNADFGYQLQASGTPSGSTIGDRVYLDLDGDGTDNSGTDPGLAGVSVSLLDSTGTVIATDLTDATGGYRFPGLPAGDYTVVVTDTGNVLAYYEQTGDPSLPTPSFDGRSTVTVDGITDNLLQDFGYRAPSQNAGNTLGVIGDTVYLDSNGDNAFDAGEGLAGVTVELFAADGTTLIATTVTDTNGGYLFAGLDSGATYVVKVDGATLPAGLTNTVDPDLTPGVAGNGESSRNLSTLGATDLAADFGYRDTSDPNSVSGLVWLDPNADGTRSAPEGVRFDGVTVELRDAAGFLIGTAITDGTGAYGFANLPDGQYTVHVTDTAGVLTGTWHSLGTDSATDPITVTLTSGTNATADFGYYRDGAALGNRAWVDADNDGLQDAGETTGAADVAISLLITYPNGATSTVVTRTGADGSYRFGDLLLDESFASSTAGTPTTGTGPRYRISAAVAPTGYVAGSKLDVGTDDKRDSDAHSGVTAAALARGDTDVTVNAADPSAETGQGSYDFSYLASGSLFSLSGTVYHDADGNGNLTERSSAGGSETALSGVSITVTLYTDPNGDGDPADGAPEGSPVVTTDGTYSFANLTAGNYVVVETNPAGYVSTNDVDAPNNDRIGVTLSANLVAQDFLDTLTANSNLGSIAGSVLTDTVGGGSFGDAGAGIPNVVVELWLDTDADGVPDTLYDTTTTDGSGNYSFTAVPPGTYVIVETNPSGYASTNDVAGANDDRIPVALDPKAALTNQNFLDYQGTPTLASLSGQVRDDADGNGNLADADSGIDGVTVTLWRDTDGNGTPDSVYGSATTGGGGLYSFTGLPVGAYVVVETDPSGYTSTADVVNPNDNRIPETLTASEEVTGRDFLDALSGVAQVAPISGRVIDDPDGDGDLPERTGEPGITGATVQLFTDPNGDGDPTDGVLYDTTVTGSNGAYSFPNVPPGNYVVVESDPAGFTSTNDTVGPNDNRIPVVRTGTTPVTEADFLDSQTPNLATLGDRVWLDENSDGVQDAGEDGLANVTVELRNASAALIATTVTDADGGYRFTGVPAGSYTVELVTASLATGLLPIADEDDPASGGGAATPHASAVTVVGGAEHLSADFGYNWVSYADTTDPNLGATGAIGDRVWNDANGNGAQDPGEAGIGGVTVGLFSDPDGNGVYDTPYAAQPTATTDAAGNYVFDGLPAGAYVVAVTPPSGGWIATGDPDTTLDGRTTTPVILAPGDAYLNADFGYQLQASGTPSGSTIGDRVYLDLDGDGTDNSGTDPGLAGVSVSLLDSTGTVIATDLTDATGGYRFPGLPAGDYTVVVTDTGNVLAYYEQTGDPSLPTPSFDGRSTVTVDGITDNLLQDFGYRAPSQNAGNTLGVIGDTVYLDSNGDNAFDAGEGLAGVTVELFAADGTTLIATTVTDTNGGYLFAGLDSGATYVVKVDGATLPAGLTNTVDPDLTPGVAGNGESSRNLSTLGATDLAADFGYRDTSDPNSVSGLVWLDPNADGTRSAPEGVRFDGVTVELRDAAGFLIGTAITDGTGAYGFANLPDGQYTVHVTDTAGVLTGTWHSLGTDSATDPITVTLTSGTNATADFGYYRDGAALGNRAWVDADNDGLQDAGETTGAADVAISLLITYPNGATSTVVTRTGADGSYRFGDLLLDESFASSTAGTPTTGTGPRYRISAAVAPTGYVAGSKLDVGTDDKRDSDAHSGVTAAPIARGDTDVTVNAADPSAETGQGSYDFSYLATSSLFSLSGTVYHDADGDGNLAERTGFGGSETALSGVSITVTLYTDPNGDGDPADGAPEGSPVVTTDGTYSFANLTAGNYVVVETNPAGYVSTNDVDAPNNDRIGVTLSANLVAQDFLDAPNAVAQVAPISGRVINDTDGDGDLSERGDEPGIVGVTVQLWTDPNGDGDPGDGEVFDTTLTSTNGPYSFPNVPPGNYVVVESDPSGFTSTKDTAGANDNRVPVVRTGTTPVANVDFLDSQTPRTIDVVPEPVADCQYGIPRVSLRIVANFNPVDNGTPLPLQALWTPTVSSVSTTYQQTWPLTWTQSNGTWVAITNILWPGMVLSQGDDVNDLVNADPISWPGYRLINGSWVFSETYEGGNLVAGATLTVTVNPEDGPFSLTYPPPGSTCSEAYPGAPPVAIPTLSPLALAVLALMLFGIGAFGARRFRI